MGFVVFGVDDEGSDILLASCGSALSDPLSELERSDSSSLASASSPGSMY